MLKLDSYEKLELDEQDSIKLNSTLTSPKTKIELPTKPYVDSLHESSRNRRDISLVFNDQDNDFYDIELTKLDSITVNKNPTLNEEVSNKKYFDDELDKK